MSVKKFLVLSAAGIATAAAGAAIAGGPDVAAPPMVRSGLYIEGDLGYAWEDWNGVTFPLQVTKNADGGFTVGGDLGYQINNNWAIEFGGYYLVSRPEVTFPQIGTFRGTDWYIYLAPKLLVDFPWVEGLDLYFKAGVAYRTVDVHFGNFVFGKTEYVRPIFGTGLQYIFDPGIILGVQYLFVPGRAGHAPDIHQLTGTIGYMFTM